MRGQRYTRFLKHRRHHSHTTSNFAKHNPDETSWRDFETKYFVKLILSYISNIVGTEVLEGGGGGWTDLG